MNEALEIIYGHFNMNMTSCIIRKLLGEYEWENELKSGFDLGGFCWLLL